MKLGIFLIGWLGIQMNMRLVTLIHTSHPPCIPNYASLVCEIYHCSNHASNSCPYYISRESFARFSNMMETMNKQQ